MSSRYKRIMFPLRKWVYKKHFHLTDAQIMLGSFLLVLLPAAFLLTLPAFSTSPISFTDALFSATSAITVTGLGVLDTGAAFTRAGHGILLCLMEIGGLGQMTFSTLFVVILGARMSLKQKALTQTQLNMDHSVNVTDLIKKIIIFALVCQLVGLFFLSFVFVPKFGWGDGLFCALFHAISAFNNAGFSLFSNSLIDYQVNGVVVTSITALIMIGGIGFTVLADLWRCKTRPSVHNNWTPIAFKRLYLHSKVMIIGTLFLVISGTLFLFWIERNNPQITANLSLGEQWMLAFFQSVTTRTAGFATVDISQMLRPSIFVIIMLMLIGAGSTSAAGGLKITTVAIALSASIGFIRKDDHVILFRRNINWGTVNRAFAMIVISCSIIVFAVFLLLLSEAEPLQVVLFEVVSAFSTVGLSIGLTEKLSEFGKFVIIVVMIIGRVGPITVSYLLTRNKKTHLRYADGRVLVA